MTAFRFHNCFYRIDDLQTLKEAREEDLRSAGLKTGDIIKIRRVLGTGGQAQTDLDSSLSNTSDSLTSQS